MPTRPRTSFKAKEGHSNDALGDEFGAFLRDACCNMLTVTKGAIYMCMSSSELDTLKRSFREAGQRTLIGFRELLVSRESVPPPAGAEGGWRVRLADERKARVRQPLPEIQ